MAASIAVVRDDERVTLASVDEAALAPHGIASWDAVALSAATVMAEVGQPWHRFPRGAMPGNFLHDQLEWLASEDFDLNRSPARSEQLQRRCERQGWGDRATEVREWLGEVLRTPIPPLGADLESVGTVLPEMEFWLPVDGLSASAIDGLCRDHLLAGCARPILPERELRGMLMGFADVVFEYGGRYWVLDYKSNHLGESDANYTPEALQGAMAAHRYDVQAGVYLLALHRLLRVRLGSRYDPEQHLGGAVFFFLRGIHGATHGCYHVPSSLELLDEFDRLLQKQPEEVAP